MQADCSKMEWLDLTETTIEVDPDVMKSVPVQFGYTNDQWNTHCNALESDFTIE